MQIYTPLSIETETVMIRNLIYHIWPTSLSKSCWMWAVDKLSEYIHVFNGKIVVAIAIENSDLESYKTDSKEETNEEEATGTWLRPLERGVLRQTGPRSA